MQKFDKFKKDVIVKTIVIAWGVSFMLLVFAKLDILCGFLFGSLLSIINFYLMARSSKKILKLTPVGARRLFYKGVGIRFLLMGAGLAIAAKLDLVNFAATVIGLFLCHVILILEGLVKKKPMYKEA